MTQAQCSPVDEGTDDALHTICFTGMNSHREHLPGEKVKYFPEPARWKTSLRASYVETDNAFIPVTKCKLGNLDTAIEVPHCRHQLSNIDCFSSGASNTHGLVDTGLDSFHCGVQAQSSLHVLLRSPANLSDNGAI